MLLALVLTVWGTIGYKVITGLNPELPELDATQTIAVKPLALNTEIEAFSISMVERDPFLGTMRKKKPNNIIAKKRKAIIWKPIEYLGTVKNGHVKHQVFIVTIDGKQCLLKKGQVKDSIQLISGNKSQINLSYKNQRKTIAIKTP